MKPLVPDTDNKTTAANPGYSGRTADDDGASRHLRVVLRADAGHNQGTGHVMRLLTLAETLSERGHEVLLATAEIDVPWLAEAVVASGVPVVPMRRDALDTDALIELRPDWVVIDSYLIPAQSVTRLDAVIPVLLLADGDSRGAAATLYLDQNLGAPPLEGVGVDSQLLGVDFALVRRAVRDAAVPDVAHVRHEPPTAVVVLGGTDPDDRTVAVARACRRIAARVSFTIVAPRRQHEALKAIGADLASWRVLPPTPDLPALLSTADVIVSAAGTSAWDAATLGTPSVLLAIVANQQASLAAVVDERLALGFDVVDRLGELDDVADAVTALLEDAALRARLVAACRARFDGRGAVRVAQALERHPRTLSAASPP